MLFGEGVRDRAGRDETEVDEHFPERCPAPVRTREGVQKLVFRQEALVDRRSGRVGRVSGAASTRSLIGGNPARLKGLRTLARQRPEHEGEPVHADHVRLDPEHEDGRERGLEPRLAPEHDADERHVQARKVSISSRPSSTPSSVEVDSPALISRSVRFAVTPALPTPWP